MTTYDQDYLDHFAHFIGEVKKQLAVDGELVVDGELLDKVEALLQPVLNSVDDFENMADNRLVAQMSCVIPAPLALVLYQRDPQLVADWYTWIEQSADG
jgi:hypothetical protein